MQETNSRGREPLKNKSINVECNLLEDWLIERQAISDKARQRLTITIGIWVFAVVFASVGLRVLEVMGQSQADAELQFKNVSRQTQALDAQGKQAAPVLAYQTMAANEHARNNLFLGNLIEIFNAAPSKVALSKLKADVVGGDLTILCSADCEDMASGNQFVTEASKGSRVQFAVLSSSHKSTVLAADGTGFDFNKKLTVGK